MPTVLQRSGKSLQGKKQEAKRILKLSLKFKDWDGMWFILFIRFGFFKKEQPQKGNAYQTLPLSENAGFSLPCCSVFCL